MRHLKYAVLFALLAFAVAGSANAQLRVAVGVGVGPVYGTAYGPPVCAHGYYDQYPYACAPYGYYGPDWFVNGVFIGAGPWYRGFHGPRFYSDGDYRGYSSRPFYTGRGGVYGGLAERPGYRGRGGKGGFPVGGGSGSRSGFHGGSSGRR